MDDGEKIKSQAGDELGGRANDGSRLHFLYELLDFGDLIPAQSHTNAKLFYDGVNKDTSRPQDKRLRVAIAQLREMLSAPGTSFAWIDKSTMFADCLAKLGSERRYLSDAVAQNIWW